MNSKIKHKCPYCKVKYWNVKTHIKAVHKAQLDAAIKEKEKVE